MRLWRVSRDPSLDGVGGLYAAGRWHTRGRVVVYTSEHAAAAQLEWLAHLDLAPEDFPPTIPFLEIDAPDGLTVEDITGSLAPNWKSDLRTTQPLGDHWLASQTSALLRVPSVVAPEHNVLINPQHPDARRITIVQRFDYPLDGFQW